MSQDFKITVGFDACKDGFLKRFCKHMCMWERMRDSGISVVFPEMAEKDDATLRDSYGLGWARFPP